MRDRMLASVIDAVRRSAVQRLPFVHACLEHVWPADVYAHVLTALPPAALYRNDRRACRQVLPLLDQPGMDPVWPVMREVLTSQELQAAVCAHFGMRARRTDGGPVSTSRPLLVRDLPGYAIEPHPDSRAKQITMQFYLAEDLSQESLGTTLYRLRLLRPAAWIGRAPFMVPVHRFPFRPNSGYLFPVRWNSYHGVERLPADAGVRHTLMNTYYWAGR